MYADERSIEEVHRIACKHWHHERTQGKRLLKIPDNVNVSQISKDSTYFVVTRSDASNNPLPGFIIISAATSMPEILAFGDHSVFCTNDMPTHIKSWMNEYHQMRSAMNVENAYLEKWLSSSVTDNDDIVPLLGEIEWNQDYPFNAKCPKKGYKRTPAGCVATALSQIMKYHGWPLHGKGAVDYCTATNKFHIMCDFENTIFQWENMLDKYSKTSVDESVSQPIATLLSAVGAAVKMDYDSDGSGASDYDAYYGMKHYMDYDSDMFIANSDDFSPKLWHKTLQNELLQNRPVYYTGQSEQGGHAFVIDGMQKDSDGSMYYHINWGWGGLCNGYYLLNLLKPNNVGVGAESDSDFSNNNSMICGLMPEDNASHQRMVCKNIALTKNAFLPEQLMQLCVESLVGISENMTATVKLMLCSKNNPDDKFELYRLNNQIFSHGRKWNDFYYSCFLPKHIPTGKYELRIECVNEYNEDIEVYADFPEIDVLDSSKWFGGSEISPKEFLGTRGRITPTWYWDDAMFSCNIDTLVNLGTSSNSGQLSFVITDTYGKMLSVMDEKTEISIPGSSVLRNVRVSGVFSSNIPDGHYWLCMGYKPFFEDKFSFVYNMFFDKSIWLSNLTLYSVPFRVSDGIIYIEGYEIQGKNIPWIPTDITNVLQTKKNTTLHDMNGMKTTHPLPKHIYIYNRKKYLLKTDK